MEADIKALEFDKIKEWLSNCCKTEGGKEKALSLFPDDDVSNIRKSLYESADALKVLSEKGRPPLYGSEMIKEAVKLSERSAVPELIAFVKILKLISCAEKIRKFLPDDYDASNSIFELCSLFPGCPELKKRLEKCVASEEELADDASPELFRIRKEIRKAEAGIRRSLDKLLREKAEFLQDVLITQRFGRYVLPVKNENKSKIHGIVHDVSGSGATIFIEPSSVVNQNNRIRELEALERDEISRILKELSLLLAENAFAVKSIIECMSELDFIFAKAELAGKMRAHQPELTKNGITKLFKARHPLLDPEKAVPINIVIGGDCRILLITGPNTGGKTVSLKTLGLFTVMAQSGLLIPAAQGSELSVYSKIMADIGDEQSIEQNLSTFSSHIKRLVSICLRADENSLIIADEIGAGTDPAEGAALAEAILSHFLESGAVCMASTHYKELKSFAIDTEGVENASCEFDPVSLKPTYRLLTGIPGSSNAFAIAEKLGLPEKIITAAEEKIGSAGLRFEELISRLEEKSAQIEKERAETEKIKKIWQNKTDELSAREAEARKKESRIISEAREKFASELQKNLDVIHEKIFEIDRLIKAGDERRAMNKAKFLRAEIAGRKSGIEAEIAVESFEKLPLHLVPDTVIEGDYYYLPHFKWIGKVTEKPDSKGMLTVQHEGIKLKVSIKELIPMEFAPEEFRTGRASASRSRSSSEGARQSSKGQSLFRKRQNFSPELKLIGLRSFEAISRLDSFIDDAVLSGIKNLRVVHGKGKGILKKEVADFLKRDKRVSDFGPAPYGEGDAGVTLVNLK